MKLQVTGIKKPQRGIIGGSWFIFTFEFVDAQSVSELSLSIDVEIIDQKTGISFFRKKSNILSLKNFRNTSNKRSLLPNSQQLDIPTKIPRISPNETNSNTAFIGNDQQAKQILSIINLVPDNNDQNNNTKEGGIINTTSSSTPLSSLTSLTDNQKTGTIPTDIDIIIQNFGATDALNWQAKLDEDNSFESKGVLLKR